MAFLFGLANILFMDETGFYQRQHYQRGWSPMGMPCYDKMDASQGKRLNLIGAMNMAEFKLIAPVTFEGSCKRDKVEHWLHSLGQSLSKDDNGSYPKRLLIMDNARFHYGGNLKQIASDYNLTLLYLPPYSPELNPVENKWAVVKQKVKLSIEHFDSLEDCVIHCSV